MALAQRTSTFESSVVSACNNAPPLRRFIPSGAPSALQGILSRGLTVNACSALHDIVHAFRRAHRIAEDDVRTETDRYRAAVVSYPVGSAPARLRKPIEELSSPAGYAELRQGSRLLSPYPPLSEEALATCSREIRAALVWSTFPGRR